MGKRTKRNSLILLKDEKHTIKKSPQRSTKKPAGTADLSDNNTTDSAVAISISAVSHHRKLKKYNPSNPLEIIIAEDNQVSFMIVKLILEKLNVNIHHARNGIEVINMVKSNPDIDLILMDIRMPLMNGMEAIKVIREITPEMPIIAQSAFSDDIDVIGLYQDGCDDFISKPINPNLLLSKIICWNL